MVTYFDKILCRAEQKRGIDVAAQYLAVALNPTQHRLLIQNALNHRENSLPIRCAMERALVIWDERDRKRSAPIDTPVARPKPCEIREQYHDEIRNHESAGTLLRWLAGLPPVLRDVLATREQRSAVVSMRSACVTRSKACAILGCTPTELDRWAKERRVVPLYTMIESFLPKQTEIRYWLIADLKSALPYIQDWRVEWQERKNARRCRLRPVSTPKKQVRMT